MTLSKSTWRIHGLNLLIYQADLSMAQLSLDRVNGQRTTGVASIFNSTFGSLKISGNHEVNVSKCNIDGISRPDVTLLDINNTNLNIKTSTFTRNHGHFHAAVLKASESNITIHHVNFTRNIGHNGVIEIGNRSSLQVENSTFVNNGHLFFALSTILVRPTGSAVVTNCTFIFNMAAFGAGLCSMANSSITVSNCSFVNNSGQLGSSINCNDDLDLVSSKNKPIPQLMPLKLQVPSLQSNYFTGKTMKMSTYPDDTPEMYKGTKYTWQNHTYLVTEFGSKLPTHTKAHSKCIIRQSIFDNNEAYSNGGAIYIEGRSAGINGSSFAYNIGGGTGGAISTFQKAKVNITNSQFKNNKAILGSAVSAKESVMISITNSNFPYLDTVHPTGFTIHASSSSLVTIVNSTFSNVRTVARILDVQNFTAVFLTDCNLSSTSAGILRAINNVKVRVQGSCLCMYII